MSPLMMSLLTLALAIGGAVESCDAEGWDRLMEFVETDVSVLRCSEDRLVLTHPEMPDSLVITRDQTETSDIYTRLVRRRGSNPYRVWCTTERLWNDPDRPRSRWRNYFVLNFLQLLRPPTG